MDPPPPPTFNPFDFIIIDPSRASALDDPDIDPSMFHLLQVIVDKGATFDFDHLLAGPRALVEAIAISACKKGQRVWLPNESPFGDSN
jgi:hypothetical protein